MVERTANAARALLAQRQFHSAARLLRLSIKDGAGAWAWQLLGVAEHGLGRSESAAQAFTRAIELDPHGGVGALCARATLRFAMHDLAGCEDDLTHALKCAPNHVQALCNLAILRERQGNVHAALELYGRVLAQDECNYRARLNRGAMRLDAGDAQGALEDFDHLARLPSCTAAVHTSRVRALFVLHRDAEALIAAEDALRLEPNNPRAVLDRGLALASLGRLDDARGILGHVTSAESSSPLSPVGVWINRLVMRQAVCAWDDRDLVVKVICKTLDKETELEAISDPGLVFAMLGLPLSASHLRKLGQVALRTTIDKGRRIAEKLPSLRMPPKRARARIGFFSASLRLHPESYLVRRLFTDRDAVRFEYFLYALNPDDGSPLRAEIASSADHFIDVSSWNAEAIVRMARSHDLDLAIDLSGAFLNSKPELFAARVAAIQAGYLATPSTLGPMLHDYRLSDPWTTPPGEQASWWEKLALLSPLPWVYDNQLERGPAGTRAQHGLPSVGFVFCCMNQAFKLDPDSFGVWMRLLTRVPGSVLWLLDNGQLANSNLLREARSRGIPEKRFVFGPRVALEQHLGRLAHADLFLDTFYCNAQTTALDALWSGIPVLTMTGTTMASRLASTFLRALGMPELAVASVTEYEAKALELATDDAALKTLRKKLKDSKQTSPLFQTEVRVRAMEKAMLAMVDRHRAGLPPDTLFIE